MQKKTFKIGEAATLVELKSYVLRYWETEFTQLVPLRTQKGQRLYTEKHIELLKNIKDLLHVRGMTLEGAKKMLASGHNLGDTALEASANIKTSADSNNAKDSEILLGKNEDDIALNVQNNSNKDELLGIFDELTLIRELLERNVSLR